MVGEVKVTPKEANNTTNPLKAESTAVEVAQAPRGEIESPPGAPVAKSDSPESVTLSKADLAAYIKTEVEQQVALRIKAIEDDDPDRELITGQDRGFNNLERKLEVYGIDIEEALPGFHVHWLNDDADRIFRMQRQGYTFVTRTEVGINEQLTPLNKDLGDRIAVYAGTKMNGDPMQTFLMKIPKALWEKHQGRIAAHNDAIDEAIRRGGIGPASGMKNSYAGTDGGRVKINIERPRFLRNH
jgi:hypothetical protein